MYRRAHSVVVIAALVLIFSFLFPFERFGVPILHITIIRMALAVGAIAVGVVSILRYCRENRTVWKSTTAGILSAIAGALGVTGGLMFTLVGARVVGDVQAGAFAALMLGIAGLLLGTVALVGSVYALKRRAWGLAFAGSICAVLIAWFLGIPAIIFVVKARSEFA